MFIFFQSGCELSFIHNLFNALFATMDCIALMIALWVHLRISLLPGHVAIGKPVGWRAAWRNTRGHALSIFGTWLAIIAPAIGLAVLVGGQSGSSQSPPTTTTSPPSWRSRTPCSWFPR
ncbi:hypothetical protein [Paraburkholderia ferrariae]|uniref:hypothetical protein n=1 Tax=Paraburkholderia ferrariae TaxID=386056 RepID=UPI0005A85A62|nr:hypothetical protein [Paraburkholderia ferrariae]